MPHYREVDLPSCPVKWVHSTPNFPFAFLCAQAKGECSLLLEEPLFERMPQVANTGEYRPSFVLKKAEHPFESRIRQHCHVWSCQIRSVAAASAASYQNQSGKHRR